MVSPHRALVAIVAAGVLVSSAFVSVQAAPVAPSVPSAPVATAADGIKASTTAAGAKYYFGAGPLDAVNTAAAEYVTAGRSSCGISVRGLAGLMLAPTYGETGAGTLAAPSPMTLSRYDVEIGLYALSNKTVYPRVFWHPGVGAWQFDDIGGWAKTASERIDVAKIAPLAASVMDAAYCRSKATKPGDEAAARAAAWKPWHACNENRCSPVFESLIAFGAIKVFAVENTGGTTPATCRIPGSAVDRDCVRVDASQAQGNTVWRVTPGGTTSMAPLSYPFTVVSDGTNEWRMWANADTGYGVDIAASKPLAANSRSKPNPNRTCERISPIKWYVNGALTDSVDRSACGTPSPAPPGFIAKNLTVNGSYTPLVGDFTGDNLDDVFWYAPGAGADSVWRSPVTSVASVSYAVNGSFRPIIGDFSGDQIDDIFWYAPGVAADYQWRGSATASGSPFVDLGKSAYQVNADYATRVGNFNNDAFDDIVWHSPTSATTHLWLGTSTGFTTYALPLGRFVLTDVGDFDGDGRADLLSYQAGAGADAIYWGTGTGFTKQAMAVNRPYRPVVGDFDLNGADDIFWYASDSGTESMWWNPKARAAPGSVSSSASSLQLGPGLTSVVLDAAGRDELIWTEQGSGTDAYWKFSGTTLTRSTAMTISRTYQFLPGRWTSANEGVLLYAPGTGQDQLWYR